MSYNSFVMSDEGSNNKVANLPVSASPDAAVVNAPVPKASGGKLFNLDGLSKRIPKPLAKLLRAPLEALLCFPRLNALYEWATSTSSEYETAMQFSQRVLDRFRLDIRVSKADMDRIPEKGPLIVVANHPYGAIEGMVLISVISQKREEFKVMANHLLGHIPEMQPLFIFVDVFETEESRVANVKGLKESLRWLKDGKALGVFPAGEVSHLDLKKRRITERDWSEHVATLAKRTKANVLPIFFPGSNSPTFHLAGLIHPRLRTMLLPREVFRRQKKRLRMYIGNPIRADRIQAFSSDRRAVRYFQLRSEALGQRKGVFRRKRNRVGPLVRFGRKHRSIKTQPIAEPVSITKIYQDLNALPEHTRLLENSGMTVFCAKSQSIPNILVELGRLREVAFRAVGEGSGKALDIDRYDRNYQHLFIWNEQHQHIVGAYRLGLIDQLLETGGMQSLYISSLFKISNRLFDEIGPTLELGRSFIMPEYQRSYAPLMMLWKGIGAFLAQNPRYRHMIGPVSISNDYKKISKAMIVRFLSKAPYRSPHSHFVQSRTPFSMRRYGRAGITRVARMVKDVRELSDVVADIEPDGKGVPILIRQYLGMNAKSLAFNVDPEFGHCLDCLCLFNVLETPSRTFDKYMGKEAGQAFRAYHENNV